MAAMRLGILGGTFDPPHLGHLMLAEAAREVLALDRLLWVPTGDPWRKATSAVSPASHRCAMVLLAIEGNPAFELSRVEVDREGPSYSANTLTSLARDFPLTERFFILGLDALRDLPNWHEPSRVIELATIVAAPRDGDRLDAAALDTLFPGLGARFVWLDMPRIDISATDLRRRVAEGLSLRYRVPSAVAAYITHHGLYAAS